MDELYRLARPQPFGERFLGKLLWREGEALARSRSFGGRCGDSHHVEPRRRLTAGPSLRLLRRSRGLRDRLREMRLIEYDQAVGAHERSVDRPRLEACSVAAEQESGPHLVNGRAYDRRGRQRDRLDPSFGPTTPHPHLERLTARRAETRRPPEALPGSVRCCAVLGLVKPFGEGQGLLEHLIHHASAVNHPEQPERNTAIPARELLGEREHEALDQGRLAGSGRRDQPIPTRPLGGEPVRHPPLPVVRPPAGMKLRIEAGEAVPHRSSGARHFRSSRRADTGANRPVPM